jgi:hypothetical protein
MSPKMGWATLVGIEGARTPFLELAKAAEESLRPEGTGKSPKPSPSKKLNTLRARCALSWLCFLGAEAVSGPEILLRLWSFLPSVRAVDL